MEEITQRLVMSLCLASHQLLLISNANALEFNEERVKELPTWVVTQINSLIS